MQVACPMQIDNRYNYFSKLKAGRRDQVKILYKQITTFHDYTTLLADGQTAVTNVKKEKRSSINVLKVKVLNSKFLYF